MTDQKIDKPLLAALRGEVQATPPVWLMRQAGRYLPEYRQVRQQAGGFLDLVYNPDLATEVTLQPVRRFGMDGAILFSDILVIPQALGQKVEFIEERGPVLEPIRNAGDLSRLNRSRFQLVLNPVYQTLRQTRQALLRENLGRTTMIGFSGAPWTLACYMVEGGSSRDFTAVKAWAYDDPDGFSHLVDILTEAVIDYMKVQIDSGAEALQLFESWAGIADYSLFFRFIVEPTRKIVDALRKHAPQVPVIGFPRQCGHMAMDYVQGTGIGALSLDSQIAPKQAAKVFQTILPVQGNLDPVCLLTGGSSMAGAVKEILAHLAGGPFIFNLGHGIIKETPPQHVADLVALVREGSRHG